MADMPIVDAITTVATSPVDSAGFRDTLQVGARFLIPGSTVLS